MIALLCRIHLQKLERSQTLEESWRQVSNFVAVQNAEMGEMIFGQ